MNERIILGCKINDITMQQACLVVRDFLMGTKTRYIVTPNAEICLTAYSNHKLQEIIKYADLSIPDSFGLKIGGWIQGQQVHNRITGVDFSEELFRIASEYKKTILLIGGRGKKCTRAIENIKQRHPKLQVSYLNGGEFSQDGISEYLDYLDRINAIQPDIILVNLGAPKQEFFMDRYKDSLPFTKVIIGVGGTIDFLSGSAKRAPKFFRTLGLEWLYRVSHEPWRWRRVFNAVFVFPTTCFIWKLRNIFLYRKSIVACIYNKEGKILLAKRKPRFEDRDFSDHWQLPQGGVDSGESLEEGCLREMQEELGIATNLLTLQAIKKNVHSYIWHEKIKLFMPYKGQKQSIAILSFTGSDADISLDQKEFTEYRWVDRHHLLQLAHEYRKPITSHALELFNKTLYHTKHD